MEKHKNEPDFETEPDDASLPESYETLKQQFEELSARYQELRMSKEKVESAVALKSQFLANMSHDLRTPLHAILSYSRFGIDKIDKIDKEKIVKYFSNIEESGRKLQEMLNQIVDLSKLESGKMLFQMYGCNLTLAVQSIIKGNRQALDSKQLSVKTEVPETITPIFCDQNRILQSLNIIFKNAIFHAPEESEVQIAMENTLLKSSDTGAGLKISITDLRTDPVSPEAIENFDAFMKTERIRTGVRIDGISLAIAYEIIRYHRGWIEVHLDHQGGTSFVIFLPVEQPEQING